MSVNVRASYRVACSSIFRHSGSTKSRLHVVGRRQESSWQTRRISDAALRSASTVAPSIAVGGAYILNLSTNASVTRCEHAIVSYPTRRSPPKVVVPASAWRHLAAAILRGWRMLKRFVKLSITLTPVLMFYPLVRWTGDRSADGSKRDAHEVLLAQHSQEEISGLLGWYLRLCLRCVEYSGAAVIKLMQWAGSRPDMFGYEFCSVFSALQDHTTPHSLNHTVRVLAEAFGKDWRKRIELGEILGSGCIGQVYKGSIRLNNGSTQDVAVKVLHPNVDTDIEADLDLMRAAVRLARWLPFDVFANLKWLNLEGVVEEFADLLKLQLDLRTEASNLKRFNENFKHQEDVVFPKLVPGFRPSKDVLVETYIKGIPVLEYARLHADNQKHLTAMCLTAVRAVCKMIFLDNFMHGDLHPGNVVVNDSGPSPKFVLYDVGIVAEYSDSDHQTIVDILAAFVRKQGRNAGRLMIDDSNTRLWNSKSGERAVDEEEFIDKIEWLTIQASSPDYFMEHLGTYISYICNAAAKHHIMMNPSFISAALAVKVEEGIALALDPSIKITTVAIPIVVESESRRYGEKAKKQLSERLEHFIARLFGRGEEKRV